MQDIQSRLLSGGGRGGDRRLRLSSHNLLNNHHHHHHDESQALKCPRCDSLNTKFCYYNNYNLSQPRHFCKSCRRYWTKGGILRNVPVGGDCRKSKRSSSSSSKPKSSTPTTGFTPPPPPPSPPPLLQPSSSNSHSSSGNSNLTVKACANNESKIFLNEPMLGFEPAGLLDQPGMFLDFGSFTSLMTSSNDARLSLESNNFITNN